LTGNDKVWLNKTKVLLAGFFIFDKELVVSKVNYLRTVLRIRSAESTSLCDDQVG